MTDIIFHPEGIEDYVHPFTAAVKKHLYKTIGHIELDLGYFLEATAPDLKLNRPSRVKNSIFTPIGSFLYTVSSVIDYRGDVSVATLLECFEQETVNSLLLLNENKGIPEKEWLKQVASDPDTCVAMILKLENVMNIKEIPFLVYGDIDRIRIAHHRYRILLTAYNELS